jgi:hypothetical protein
VTAAAPAVHDRDRATWLRTAVASDAVVIAVLSVGVLILAALTWETWGDLHSDTGYDLQAGIRVAHGAVPYRDFTYFYGPLAPALSGLAVLLGGASFGSMAVLGLLVTGAILACTYALARCYVEPLGAGIATGITAAVAFIPDNYSYVLPHSAAATLGTLFLLGTLLCLSRSRPGASAWWTVGAGACVGLATLTKPEVTAGAVGALVAWLLVRRSRRDAELAAAPALTLPLVVYAPLIAVGGLHRVVFENLYPVDFMRSAGNHLLKARMPLDAHGIAQLTAHTVAYAVGAAAIVVCGLAFGDSRIKRPLLVVLALAGLLLVAGSVADPDKLRQGFYWFYGWIPVGAAVAAVLVVRRARRAGWTTAARLELAGSVALAVCAATSFNFVFNGWRPQPAVYYAPLAAILIVRLHLVELARTRAAYALGVAWLVFLLAAGAGLTVKSARSETVAVHGPGGTLKASPADGRLYQEALHEIETRGGGDILLAPLLTGLYGLADRQSPLRELSLIPGTLAAPGAEQLAIRQLESSDTRLVITDRRTWPGYGHSSFGTSFDRNLAQVIRRDFTHVSTLQTAGDPSSALDVFIRRGK